MAPKTPTNLYYTVPLNDDELESQDYYRQEKTPTAPWFSVPVRSAAVAVRPRSSPVAVLKEKLLSSWSNDNDNHHNIDGQENEGSRGFRNRWVWLVHAVLLTISMTLFALSMCTLQTATAATNAAAVQCQAAGEGANGNSPSNFVPRSFFDENVTDTTAPAVVLPVPIVVPESQHVDMEVSVDDRTSMEDVD
ncbi:hypothetical protein B0T20DRAFT_162478 [Sordaria brevicollis]|uniref:Transmembrane protein n=1 Tax=Sordaria brevicollis TaxID=83679 RepID=A0AAE0UEH8_SORBR|nr:hypothetical protein B0T20DRAFT_162478 [Sordaria brevicollis]